MDVFERHTLLNKLSARRRLYTATMEHGEKMLTYLNRVKQLAATLKSMGVAIDDQELAMAALNGLPSTYESLIVALDACLLYTSPSPRDQRGSRMPSSA